VRSYMRCTTNPDPDSFVRGLIAWWIDEDGFPVKARSGVLRWFLRRGDDLVWADTREELLPMCAEGEQPLSLTFIHARLADNPALEKADPGYRARLMALPEVERERLLGGNWDIRDEGGKYVTDENFARRWSVLPPINVYIVSDFAVTEKPPDGAGKKDPDFTEHGVFGIDPEGNILVIDWWYGQKKADVWIERLLDLVVTHKDKLQFWFGEAGVIQKAVEPALTQRMRERSVYFGMDWLPTIGGESRTAAKKGFADSSKRAKAIKGRAFQARAAQGKILFPPDSYAPWVARVIKQCVGFPVGHDDAFDVMSNMCRAINNAHPAIVLPPKPAKEDRWDKAFQKRGNGVTDRTV
jgi:predicted phage terminase large subunit-like protein